MRRYPSKIYKQVMRKVIGLQFNPRPHDSEKKGKGYTVDTGEYRVFYVIGYQEQLVRVLIVGNRNNDAIYKQVKRLGLL
ncbi:MAG: type II toxin-antitoxin system RelE/ParE family toxin [Dehalococcoidia bacterium]|nr:type II toxin-antitoxin system RelE/ParE family toxin [Dehalococcoidia bacterium]